MTIEEIVERALDESLDDVPDDGTLIRLGADAVRIAAQCRSAARDACLAAIRAAFREATHDFTVADLQKLRAFVAAQGTGGEKSDG